MSRIADPKAKSALIRAAEQEFAEHGLGGAKVEDIARKAGLSKGAFYLHFESKEAALLQIVEEWLARCASHFAPPTEYVETLDDPDALLDFVIERDVRLYEFFWQTRSTLGILRLLRGEYLHLTLTFRAEMQRRSREWLEQWRRDGLVRPEVDPELASALISGAYEELTVRLVRSDRRPAFEPWLDFAQETFVRAYGTPTLIAALERRNRRTTTGIHELRRIGSSKSRSAGRVSDDEFGLAQPQRTFGSRQR